jgi:glutaredoxin 3
MYTIYSKPNCTYCEQAKYLLTAKGLTYEELIIDVGQLKEDDRTYVSVQQLKDRVPTAQTVPQIFKGDAHLGGFEALKKSLM